MTEQKERNKAKGKQAKWTIMVYMMADGVLTNFAVESLKQLKAVAGEDVVVAAQFDAAAGYHGRSVRRFIFDSARNRNSGLRGTKFTGRRSVVMTKPSTLAHFINWAYKARKADHHCLVFWTEGPCLGLEAARGQKSKHRGAVQRTGGQRPARLPSSDRYFSPVQLAQALRQANKKIDIIGMDACSMSMIEFAYELRDLAGFMVASQEEVPYASFPYRALVNLFREKNRTIECLCKSTVQCYVNAYRNYVCNARTETAGVTLSALRLEKMGTIAGPLRTLTSALQSSAFDEKVDRAIYAARAKSQGFVGGLFVDLYDFCTNLSRRSRSIPLDLRSACAQVRKAIKDSDSESACVVANKAMNRVQANGVSVYFPYLKDGNEIEQIERPLVKGPGGDTIGKGPGGDTIGKGPGGDTIGKDVTVVNAAAINARYAVRREIIADTEDYYKERGFAFGRRTGWDKFITGDWPRILSEQEPHTLDLRYSAQQCALNLLAQCRKPRPVRRQSGGERRRLPTHSESKAMNAVAA